MALTSTEKLQEAFSLALEDRSTGYQDLVSNANALLKIMKDKGQMKPFEGPTIRERLLFAESGTYVRYAGLQFLNPSPAELINDAEFTPKLAAVSVVLSNEDILKNSGSTAQLLDIMDVHIEAAEQELKDRFVEDLHSDGSAADGNQIGGLQLAIPTTVNSGTYGGISRADHTIWRTSTYDANSDFSSVTTETAINASGIKQMFNMIMVERSRGQGGPDCILAAQAPYLAYMEATETIQRITDGGGKAGPGFPSLKYYGAGKSVDIYLEGGIGSAMPDNIVYFVDSDALRFRYHKDRNFVRFGGKQTPINQDAVVQHIGFFGELTMVNPLHMAKLYDSA